MEYAAFIKRLPLPPGFQAPVRLNFEDLAAKPLSAADLEADLAAVNSSSEIIHRTRGGSWPEGELSREYDLRDLVWHEHEFREGSSFAYVVYDVTDTYIGCFYLNPLGQARPLTSELAAYDVDLNWWVTTSAYDAGYYEKLYRAIQVWLAGYFPFTKIWWANAEIPA